MTVYVLRYGNIISEVLIVDMFVIFDSEYFMQDV
jgi:hypothetical protein